MAQLSLAFGLEFDDLYEHQGLSRLDQVFDQFVDRREPAVAERLRAARAASDGANRGGLALLEQSQLMLDLAPHLEVFLGKLFGITEQVAARTQRHLDLAVLSKVKRFFVQRQAVKSYGRDQAETFSGDELRDQLEALMGGPLDQLTFAQQVTAWQEDSESHAEALDVAKRYAAWATLSEAGQQRHSGDVVFHVVAHTDYDNLVPAQHSTRHGVSARHLPAETCQPRDGFNLTDSGTDLVGALDQAHYCVLCHHQGRDACRHGLVDRKTGDLQKNPLGVTLFGCPLDERISEMHEAMVKGWSVAALAIATVDNPLLAGTGHRICNDCMKSCIFQKQEPVNIPEVESRMLKDVLDLPWGFEIYSLLTRWNPLNFDRPIPHADSGYAILVVGLGPAGLTLSHHLLNQGHRVVAIDGLKIEPLAPEISGVDPRGQRSAFAPIYDWTVLRESLDRRIMAGFGGVAEYGITVRWDKNFLTVLRLLLERRRSFTMHGGVRFGGTLSPEQAFAMGFDHVALCAGAGAPTVLDMENNLACGVRQASDFLMGLQLTGAAKQDSLANLQIRLPVVVIGGGLTAIDTATEALAYYQRQVEKFLVRYEVLEGELGAEQVTASWRAEDRAIAEEFLSHGRALRAEAEAAQAEGRTPRFVEMLDGWGGATIAYRRRMMDAPSYTLNHEEIIKALEQGVRFAELLSPVAVEVDEFGSAKALRLERQQRNEEGRLRATGEQVTLPARSILVAAGTQPNTVLAQERPGLLAMDGKYYQAFDEAGQPVTPEASPKPSVPHVLMHQRADGRTMSFFGDLHPSFAGNVVKAMAGAKQGYPVIDRAVRQRPPAASGETAAAQLDAGVQAVVERVERLTPTIVEVIIKAPLAAQAFKPGQFFRLQNYEALAARTDKTVLAMEGLALTGAWVDVDQGLVSLIVLEMGGSSNLCAHLKPGEPVVLMGPTGAPTETPGGETVLLAGGGLGNAVLFSIGKALRDAGSRVLYFAAYKLPADRYYVENIEAAADTVVWCCDVAPGFTPGRPQDKTFVGNVVEAMMAYASGQLGSAEIALSEADRLIAIGSDRMMAAVAAARHDQLKPFLKTDHVAIGSINSPMQCMMKKICAQCLQRHVDPETGETRVVFSCFNQDQPLDQVDFGCLNQRLMQNALQEKLAALWIKRELKRL